MKRRLAALFLASLLVDGLALAGGPLTVTGPASLQPGKAFVWDTSAPIPYTVDSGPLSTTPTGQVVIPNAQGITRVQSLFGNWQSVPTAAISFSYAGPIAGVVGGDVKTVQDFNSVTGACQNGTQNPVIFDANGSILKALGLDPLVIGFASTCKLDTQNGRILAAFVLLNGQFQDGVDTGSNFELSADQFDEAITHEIGHLSGLDHSQINLQEFLNGNVDDCDPDALAGLPLMFPVAFCQSRKSAGLPILSPDDVAWISTLYPAANYSSSYGSIHGRVLFPDGITAMQGANVVARLVDNPATPEDESQRVAVSVVSGFEFTGNPGQSVTGNNTGGSPFGSRDPSLIGYYEIPVPPGTYTLQVETIDQDFAGGSSVGPLDPPILMGGSPEFWHQYESAYDDVARHDPITVQAGQSIGNLDFITNGTFPRFDGLEDGQVRLSLPEPPFVFRGHSLIAAVGVGS